MENIIEPTESFDFSGLTLASPVAIQGGAYFTKILNNGRPLYIQTSQSLSKQGFVKSGKRYYCDLMFDNDSSILINWFEKLEERSQQLILSKSATWFQNPLDISDIENAFSSIVKVYKSGKYYLVRTNVKNSSTNEPYIKIYDENETPLGISEITSETIMISILEIQGIKFTSRNFQVEIEVKQVMVIRSDPIFKQCMIRNAYKNKEKDKQEEEEKEDELGFEEKEREKEKEKEREKEKEKEKEREKEREREILEEEEKEEKEEEKEKSFQQEELEKEKKEEQTTLEEPNVSLDIQEMEGNGDELELVDIDCLDSSNLDSISLRKPNQVYFEIYKEAKNKAKMAKKAAIIAYLEAKNIKKTYMIETINDSDSDFDAEIDDVSESELDGF
jgi:flagellar biosynthesis GTPase FlhF